MSRPDLVGAHHEAAGLVERARDHGGPDFLGNRHRFACDQRFVERGAALQNDAVHRHLLTRTNPQVIAGLQAVDLDFMVGAVIADPARGLRRQLQQRLIAPEVASRRAVRAPGPCSTRTVMTAAASK